MYVVQTGLRVYGVLKPRCILGPKLPFVLSTRIGLLAAMSKTKHIDVCIVIALREEFRELFNEVADIVEPFRDDLTGRYYFLFARPSAAPNDPYQCVATFIGNMGPVDAALATQDMVTMWKPKTVVMLGIAAGIHEDVRLGDVVYATQVDGYIESAKAEPVLGTEQFQLAPGGSIYRCSEQFIRLFDAFEFVHKDAYDQWRSQCATDLKSLINSRGRDVLREAALLRDSVAIEGVHLASGPIVGASIAFTKWLHKRDRTLKALEMEAYGFVKAVLNPLKASSTVVLRGISDFGDERKKELDQVGGGGAIRRYAVRNALRFLWNLLSVGGLPKLSRRSSGPRNGKRTADSAALRKVRRLSLVAVQDAGFIIDDPGGHPSGEIRLEQNLYVNRSIEEEIYRYFDTSHQDDPPFIMVAGEAGFGKTSLLWQMHGTLMQRDRWEPWFIKSTFLLGQSPGDGRRSSLVRQNMNVQQLELAASAMQTQGIRPAVLIDTADILLGNENDRYFLIDMLLALRECGCAIVVATRPQEAAYLRSLEDIKRLDLRDYNDQELEDAISKHVKRFYARTSVRDLSEHVQRIRNAVASGLPVHDVCKNPLTLRMLFTLYAPEEVSLEINAFSLYEDFWNMRVVRDHRAGSPYPQHGTDDLTQTASAIALVMLAEGSPEVDHRLVEGILPEMKGSERELKQLVSRGIIRLSEGRTLRFFHQTFFEHSAARSLLTRFRARSIGLLEERMKDRPNDLFVSPIFEHLLLLCESQPTPIRTEAECAFTRLLGDTSLIARSSAIYIYGHQQRLSDRSFRVVQNALPSEETAIVSRFVNIAHNMPHLRIRHLMEHLDAIWERHKWEEQYDVLELLERLAARSPELTMEYLYRHRILAMIAKMPPLGYLSLFKTLVTLVGRDSSLCDTRLIERLLDTLTATRNRNLQTGILNTLREIAKYSGEECLPDRCEKVLHAHLQSVKDSTAFQGFGRVFAQGWRLSKTSINEILARINQAEVFVFKSWLYAVSELLLASDVDEAEAAKVWRHYRDESDLSRQWQWSNIVLPRILRGNTDAAPGAGNSKTVVHYFRDGAKKLIARESEAFISMTQMDKGDLPSISMACVQIISAINYARLPTEVLTDLLDCKPLERVEPWLAETGFANLLAEAYAAGHPGATSAAQLLMQTPRAYPAKVVSAVATGLTKLAGSGQTILENTIRLLVKTDNAGGLNRLLESDTGPSSEFLRKIQPELSAMRQRLVGSSSGAKRRQGVWLWTYLLNMGLDAPPSMDQLQQLMTRESDRQAYAWLAFLFGPSLAKGDYDLEKVMEALLPLCTDNDENLREKAMAGLFEAVINAPDPPARFAGRVLEAALNRPTNANRLSKIGMLIDRLISESTELAASLVEQLLQAPEVAELGHQAKRVLITRLRQPIRTLFRLSSFDLHQRLLDIVPNVDPFMGRILVDAACHDAFLETVPILDGILCHPDVDGKVKELIRRHKHQRERTTGGGSWPELYNEFIEKEPELTI